MKRIFLSLVAVFCFGFYANAQTECEPRVSTFLLLFENTENGIKIKGGKGSAFEELSFPLAEDQTQEIDQFGLRNSNDRVRGVNNENLVSFRFTVQKTKEGFVLEGIEGTAWKRLNIRCGNRLSIPASRQNCTVMIDQKGTLSL